MTAITKALTAWTLEHARRQVVDTNSEQMTSEVLITRGDDALLGTDGELVADPNAAVVYAGPCHLGTAAGPVTYTIGDEVQFFSSGSATIPLEWDPGDGTMTATLPQVNDLLTVTGADDYGMVGRHFRIVDVENLGTLAGYRHCQIIGIARSPGWVDSAVRHPAVGTVPDEVPPEWRVG